MKTTVEIPDSLLEQVRRQAASEGSTVRALVEEGLRRVLEERQRKAGSFSNCARSHSGERGSTLTSRTAPGIRFAA